MSRHMSWCINYWVNHTIALSIPLKGETWIQTALFAIIFFLFTIHGATDCSPWILEKQLLFNATQPYRQCWLLLSVWSCSQHFSILIVNDEAPCALHQGWGSRSTSWFKSGGYFWILKQWCILILLLMHLLWRSIQWQEGSSDNSITNWIHN